MALKVLIPSASRFPSTLRWRKALHISNSSLSTTGGAPRRLPLSHAREVTIPAAGHFVTLARMLAMVSAALDEGRL